ncbi:hypothetical protein NDU88_002853 [Pleurodeles waltl]|uniref:Uncharacterized protein n=1 Tax=Pleurodeles waltl TaxID=8319 RepID=A0AAV7REZ6_PLEWA|nr:hypothetical protein NDU88_002853 [Pleurodeles waltl]
MMVVSHIEAAEIPINIIERNSDASCVERRDAEKLFVHREECEMYYTEGMTKLQEEETDHDEEKNNKAKIDLSLIQCGRITGLGKQQKVSSAPECQKAACVVTDLINLDQTGFMLHRLTRLNLQRDDSNLATTGGLLEPWAIVSLNASKAFD